ncbi:MAG: 30S ribosomal protein S7 [Elusimicrobia bacterium]|nr:30S ribosomal protein S7 [Candidatus Liberimonas magnetica]
MRKKLKPKEHRVLTQGDYKYNSLLIARLINKLNFCGKKNTAERIIYTAFDIIKEKTKENPLEVFNRAMENVRPLLEVRPRRVGGATYQVPMEVDKIRSTSLAMRWLTTFASERKGKPMAEKLAMELIEASRNEGPAIKKRADTHKMAEANKAFAHYRW